MKGIMFSEGNFRAIVAGSKTQTRRIIKPVPDDSGLHNHTAHPMSLSPEYDMRGWWGNTESTSETREFKPRYKTGEILYLKEPYLCTGAPEGRKAEFDYLYGKNEEPRIQILNRPDLKGARTMPARAARYFIKITDVRAERVQDISERDCIAEGIYQGPWMLTEGYNYTFPENWNPHHFRTPQEAYAAEFDQIYGKGSWDENPWVWVYEFEMVENGTVDR